MRFDNPVETDHDLSYHRNDSLNKNYVSWTLLLIGLVLVEWSHLSQLLVIFNSFSLPIYGIYVSDVQSMPYSHTLNLNRGCTLISHFYQNGNTWGCLVFPFNFFLLFFFLNYQWQQLIIKTKATDVFFIRIRSKVHTLRETKKIHLDCKRVVYRLDKQLRSVDIPISGNMVRFCGRIR